MGRGRPTAGCLSRDCLGQLAAGHPFRGLLFGGMAIVQLPTWVNGSLVEPGESTVRRTDDDRCPACKDLNNGPCDGALCVGCACCAWNCRCEPDGS
jgi:hypothetical protein